MGKQAVSVTKQVAKRGYWREADARVLLEAWRSSGEPLSRFAKRYGVKRERLARWQQRLNRADAPTLHRVHLVDREAEGSDSIELHLPEGYRIVVPPGVAVEDLKRVLSVLTGPVPC